MAGHLAPDQHDSLPDVPEPSETSRLFGHGEAAAHLAAAYRAGKLHHGLLLTGPKGIGKATLAFHLAYHLLRYPIAADAPATLAEPDPDSALARQIASGAHPSVLHLTKPYDEKTKKFRTAITVEEVRRVARFLAMRTHDDSYRIVIVDSADDLNRNAANALLKNLEEPPSRAVFVLISHMPGGLLPTIRSRCQQIRLAPRGRDDLAAALSLAKPGAATDDALLQAAEGSPRTAILMTEYGGLELAQAADDYLGKARRDPADAYKLADAVTGRERDIQFELLNTHLLDRIASAAGEAARSGDARRADRLAELWQQASTTIGETTTYNLDRRQHVVALVEKVAAALQD